MSCFADIPEKERFILNGLLERMKVFDYDLAAARCPHRSSGSSRGRTG